MNKRKFAIDWTKSTEKIKEQNAPKKNWKDERLYYPQIKDNGTAEAIIRFLPSKDTDIPFVKTYNHAFDGPGGWYINECPTTIAQECPTCKANTELWNSDPDTVRRRSRKTNYYTNILVVKDPQNPENEGKVFLFKYGKTIHEKIMSKISPEEGGIDEPVMVFDYYDGANFKFKIKTQKVSNTNMPNYDLSVFDNPSPVGTDEEIEKIHGMLYSLTEFTGKDRFKSYNDLKERFEKVTGKIIIPVTNAPTTAPTSTPQTVTTPAASGEKTVFDGDDETFFNDLQNG